MRALLFNSNGFGGVDRSALKKFIIKFVIDKNANTETNNIMYVITSLTIILCFFLRVFLFSILGEDF